MDNLSSPLDPKVTELIAIGTSIGGGCMPCLRYHIAEAIRLGVSIDEIEEAIKLGKMTKERAINDIYKLAEDLINKEKEKLTKEKK